LGLFGPCSIALRDLSHCGGEEMVLGTARDNGRIMQLIHAQMNELTAK
jgi:hypothetical protein